MHQRPAILPQYATRHSHQAGWIIGRYYSESIVTLTVRIRCIDDPIGSVSALSWNLDALCSFPPAESLIEAKKRPQSLSVCFSDVAFSSASTCSASTTAETRVKCNSDYSPQLDSTFWQRSYDFVEGATFSLVVGL